MTSSIALELARNRTTLGLALVVIGAPIGAAAISIGAPETAVYYGAFFLAAVATVGWLSRSRPTPVGHSIRGRALIVEDEEYLRNIIVNMLTVCGMHVEEASSGTEALATLERVGSNFDVVLCDVRVPDTSGEHLIDMLRRDRPDQAIVLLDVHAYSPNVARHPAFRIVGASPPSHIIDQLKAVLSKAT
jgi:CheY-like chemotaxis protein